jgi:hypothetical protein
MTSLEVKAELRPLKCEWTREMAKDLQVHRDVDMSSFELFIVKQMRTNNRKNSIKNIFPN